MLHVQARHVHIGLGHHWVFAHDIERANATRVCVRQNLSGRQPALAAQPTRFHVPRRVPTARLHSSSSTGI